MTILNNREKVKQYFFSGTLTKDFCIVNICMLSLRYHL